MAPSVFLITPLHSKTCLLTHSSLKIFESLSLAPRCSFTPTHSLLTHFLHTSYSLLTHSLELTRLSQTSHTLSLPLSHTYTHFPTHWCFRRSFSLNSHQPGPLAGAPTSHLVHAPAQKLLKPNSRRHPRICTRWQLGLWTASQVNPNPQISTRYLTRVS